MTHSGKACKMRDVWLINSLKLRADFLSLEIKSKQHNEIFYGGEGGKGGYGK